MGCFSSGWYVPTVTWLTTQASHRGRKCMKSILAKSIRSAGSRVRARRAAMAMARFLVQARGRKSRPSWSTRVKMGRKATAITSREKKTEGPTSRSASSRTAWKSPLRPPCSHSSSFL
jgi:hypothetical protein